MTADSDAFASSSSSSSSSSTSDEYSDSSLSEGKRRRGRRRIQRRNSTQTTTAKQAGKRSRKTEFRLQSTETPSSKDDSGRAASGPYALARQRLHVSAVPDVLPGRTQEFGEIQMRVESALSNRQGCCVYISGVPGTGKTATVRDVMRSLKQRVDNGDGEDFDFVEINGMKLTDPNVAYALLWQGMGYGRVPPHQARDFLANHFSKPALMRKQKLCVAMIDELDLLMTRKQHVMYNFFQWPSLPDSKLIIIAIANTMDLPERTLTQKVSSRLGLNRIYFQAYKYQELEEILQARLAGLEGIYDPMALSLCARKVGSVSGDARRTLDVFRRAVEIVELEHAQKGSDDAPLVRVTAQTICTVLEEMTASNSVKILSSLALHQKLFLFALTVQFKQTGIAEAEFGPVATKHLELCRVHNLDPPTTSDLASICAGLGALKVLMVEAGKADLYQRIHLLIAEADLQTAFANDAFMSKLA